MNFLGGRYARSRYAPAPFIYAMALAFALIAVIATVSGDWLVTALGLIAAAATIGIARLARRFAATAEASLERSDSSPAQEHEHHGR